MNISKVIDKGFVLPFLVIVVIIVLLFKDLPKTFYQQDEWHGLGLVFSEGIQFIFSGTFRPIDLLFAKGRILSNLILYFFVANFPLQNAQLSIFAIVLHIVATFLVFILIKKFVRNIFISLLGAVFFAANAVSHGAVTWPAIAINAVGSSILVLLSVYFFLRYLESSRPKFFLLTGIALYLSLWFKETGLYLFMFYPIAILFFKQYKLKAYLAKFWWFLTGFFLIAGYRILELRFGTPDPNLYISAANENFFLTILIRLVLYPLTSFSLMYVPGQPFIEFAREVLIDNYKFFANVPNDLLIAQTVILDLLAVILTGLIVLLIALFLRKETAGNKKAVLFWLTFTALSFTPYVVLSKDFAYLESRYFYLPVAAGAILFSWLLTRFWAIFGKKVFLILFLPLTLAFIFWHANSVVRAIDEQNVLSGWRRDFMSELQSLVPTLTKDKNVFYIDSNKNYWADGNRIPFQQGSGYTLMVLYWHSGKIPREFLRDGYLFEITSQGYKESGDLGFGYFWEFEGLNSAIKSYNLAPESVIKLKYDSVERKLTRVYD